MTRNASRWKNRRPCYKAAVHVPDFDTRVPATELSLPIQLCRHIYKGIIFCICERERECRIPMRERKLCSGNVGFVTWRSPSNDFTKYGQRKRVQNQSHVFLHVCKSGNTAISVPGLFRVEFCLLMVSESLVHARILYQISLTNCENNFYPVRFLHIEEKTFARHTSYQNSTNRIH